MSALQGSQGGGGPCHVVPVQRLPAPDLGHGGYDFPGHTEAVGDVVSCHVVFNQPEERRQRTGLAAGPGARELRDGLDLAAQIETGYDPT
jgi:hypothetical protein